MRPCTALSLLFISLPLRRAVVNLSYLTFLTISWLGFTALELSSVKGLSRQSAQVAKLSEDDCSACDSDEEALLQTKGDSSSLREQSVGHDECSFCRTDVELGLGLVVLVGWLSRLFFARSRIRVGITTDDCSTLVEARKRIHAG